MYWEKEEQELYAQREAALEGLLKMWCEFGYFVYEALVEGGKIGVDGKPIKRGKL